MSKPATLVLAYGLRHPSLPSHSDELCAALNGAETDLTLTRVAQLSANYAGPAEVCDEQLVAAGDDTTVETERGARHGHLNEPLDDAGPRGLDRIVGWLEAHAS